MDKTESERSVFSLFPHPLFMSLTSDQRCIRFDGRRHRGGSEIRDEHQHGVSPLSEAGNAACPQRHRTIARSGKFFAAEAGFRARYARRFCVLSDSRKDRDEFLMRRSGVMTEIIKATSLFLQESGIPVLLKFRQVVQQIGDVKVRSGESVIVF